MDFGGYPARGLILLFGGILGTGDAVRSLGLPTAGECIRKGCVSVMGDMVPSFEL